MRLASTTYPAHLSVYRSQDWLLLRLLSLTRSNIGLLFNKQNAGEEIPRLFYLLPLMLRLEISRIIQEVCMYDIIKYAFVAAAIVLIVIGLVSRARKKK